MNIKNVPNNQNFTARCPQIREAQLVCRKVNSTYPHISVSKIRSNIHDLGVRYGVLNKEQKVSSLSFLQPNSMHNKAFRKLYNFGMRVSEKFFYIRKAWGTSQTFDALTVDKVLWLFKRHKMGNCGEEAFAAAALLRQRGYKNVYAVPITKNRERVDHAVCIYNFDDSPFKNKITNKTIIIDPWIGKADFAHNIFREYKNLYSSVWNISENDKLGTSIRLIHKLDLDDMDIFCLGQKYPEFFSEKSQKITLVN